MSSTPSSSELDRRETETAFLLELHVGEIRSVVFKMINHMALLRMIPCLKVIVLHLTLTHDSFLSMRACASDVSLYILPWRMQVPRAASQHQLC
jgi:hypothetical protein